MLLSSVCNARKLYYRQCKLSRRVAMSKRQWSQNPCMCLRYRYYPTNEPKNVYNLLSLQQGHIQGCLRSYQYRWWCNIACRAYTASKCICWLLWRTQRSTWTLIPFGWPLKTYRWWQKCRSNVRKSCTEHRQCRWLDTSPGSCFWSRWSFVSTALLKIHSKPMICGSKWLHPCIRSLPTGRWTSFYNNK